MATPILAAMCLACLLIGLPANVTSSSTNHVLEALVVVEKSAFDNWKSVTGKTKQDDFKREMRSVLVEAAEILKTLEDYQLNIRLQCSELVILNTDISNPSKAGQIWSKPTGTLFQKWLNAQNKKYDVALLYTGNNLMSSSSNRDSSGWAWQGSVCRPKAMAILESTATFQDALITAHEIGHLLNADHDGVEDATDCKADDGYIMRWATKNDSRNHFTFSKCSADEIKKKLKGLTDIRQNCLTNEPRDNRIIDDKRFGSLMTADDVCRREHGSGSYVARHVYRSYDDSVCTVLRCGAGWKVLTPQGMVCGKSKHCVRGECVETACDNSGTSDLCPYGDQPTVRNGKEVTTCDKVAKEKKCGNGNNARACCESCDLTNPGLHSTPDDVCKGFLGSQSVMSRIKYAHNGYGDKLCGALRCVREVVGKNIKTSGRRYRAPNGMACGKGKRCNTGRCVTTTVGGSTDIPDECPYGDPPVLGGTYPASCAVLANNGNRCSGARGKLCCGSCRGK